MSPEGPSSESSPQTRSRPVDIGRMVRPVGVLAVLVLVLARAVAPALRGVFVGTEKLIGRMDLIAGVGSQLLAFVVSATCIGLMISVVRANKISLFSRMILVGQPALVLVLGVWATRARLSATGATMIGVLACLIAIVGAIEGLREPRTRALGVVLASTSVAALMHITSAALVGLAPERLMERVSGYATVLSTLSLLVTALSLLVSLVWIASRRRAVASPATLAALGVAVLLASAMARAAKPNPSPWYVFAGRAIDRLVPTPTSNFPLSVASFIVVLAPCLAVAALATRKQIPAVTGALAITLTAGALVDTPLHAMLLTLAGLATALASRDDRAMWETLIGRPLS